MLTIIYCPEVLRGLGTANLIFFSLFLSMSVVLLYCVDFEIRCALADFFRECFSQIWDPFLVSFVIVLVASLVDLMDESKWNQIRG